MANIIPLESIKTRVVTSVASNPTAPASGGFDFDKMITMAEKIVGLVEKGQSLAPLLGKLQTTQNINGTQVVESDPKNHREIVAVSQTPSEPVIKYKEKKINDDYIMALSQQLVPMLWEKIPKDYHRWRLSELKDVYDKKPIVQEFLKLKIREEIKSIVEEAVK